MLDFLIPHRFHMIQGIRISNRKAQNNYIRPRKATRKRPIKTQQTCFPLQLHLFSSLQFKATPLYTLKKCADTQMSEYMWFVQRFDRSYTFHCKSMGAQSHIPRKHCPSMLKDDPCRYEQSAKKRGRACHSLLLHYSYSQAVIAQEIILLTGHLNCNSKIIGVSELERSYAKLQNRQTQITSELVMEKYLHCAVLDTELVSFAMHFAQQFSNIFNK